MNKKAQIESFTLIIIIIGIITLVVVGYVVIKYGKIFEDAPGKIPGDVEIIANGCNIGGANFGTYCIPSKEAMINGKKQFMSCAYIRSVYPDSIKDSSPCSSGIEKAHCSTLKNSDAVNYGSIIVNGKTCADWEKCANNGGKDVCDAEANCPNDATGVTQIVVGTFSDAINPKACCKVACTV